MIIKITKLKDNTNLNINNLTFNKNSTTKIDINDIEYFINNNNIFKNQNYKDYQIFTSKYNDLKIINIKIKDIERKNTNDFERNMNYYFSEIDKNHKEEEEEIIKNVFLILMPSDEIIYKKNVDEIKNNKDQWILFDEDLYIKSEEARKRKKEKIKNKEKLKKEDLYYTRYYKNIYVFSFKRGINELNKSSIDADFPEKFFKKIVYPNQIYYHDEGDFNKGERREYRRQLKPRDIHNTMNSADKSLVEFNKLQGFINNDVWIKCNKQLEIKLRTINNNNSFINHFSRFIYEMHEVYNYVPYKIYPLKNFRNIKESDIEDIYRWNNLDNVLLKNTLMIDSNNNTLMIDTNNNTTNNIINKNNIKKLINKEDFNTLIKGIIIFNILNDKENIQKIIDKNNNLEFLKNILSEREMLLDFYIDLNNVVLAKKGTNFKHYINFNKSISIENSFKVIAENLSPLQKSCKIKNRFIIINKKTDEEDIKPIIIPKWKDINIIFENHLKQYKIYFNYANPDENEKYENQKEIDNVELKDFNSTDDYISKLFFYFNVEYLILWANLYINIYNIYYNEKLNQNIIFENNQMFIDNIKYKSINKEDFSRSFDDSADAIFFYKNNIKISNKIFKQNKRDYFYEQTIKTYNFWNDWLTSDFINLLKNKENNYIDIVEILKKYRLTNKDNIDDTSFNFGFFSNQVYLNFQTFNNELKKHYIGIKDETKDQINNLSNIKYDEDIYNRLFVYYNRLYLNSNRFHIMLLDKDTIRSKNSLNKKLSQAELADVLIYDTKQNKVFLIANKLSTSDIRAVANQVTVSVDIVSTILKDFNNFNKESLTKEVIKIINNNYYDYYNTFYNKISKTEFNEKVKSIINTLRSSSENNIHFIIGIAKDKYFDYYKNKTDNYVNFTMFENKTINTKEINIFHNNFINYEASKTFKQIQNRIIKEQEDIFKLYNTKNTDSTKNIDNFKNEDENYGQNIDKIFDFFRPGIEIPLYNTMIIEKDYHFSIKRISSYIV